MNKIVISERIKGYRKEHKLKQVELAGMLGVSPQAISKWEREECYPDIFLLPDLAHILGCSVADFFS